MFQTKDVQKIKTHILCSVSVFKKSYRLWDTVERYGRDSQATDDNIIRRMFFECWIIKAADTLRVLILVAFTRHQWLHERASMLFYAYRTLPDLFLKCFHTLCIVYIMGPQFFQNLGATSKSRHQNVTWRKLHKEDPQFWIELWESSLSGALCSVLVDWHMFLYARKNFTKYAENVRRHPNKI
jgi:hypothetical protein